MLHSNRCCSIYVNALMSSTAILGATFTYMIKPVIIFFLYLCLVYYYCHWMLQFSTPPYILLRSEVFFSSYTLMLSLFCACVSPSISTTNSLAKSGVNYFMNWNTQTTLLDRQWFRSILPLFSNISCPRSHWDNHNFISKLLAILGCMGVMYILTSM